MNPFAAWEADKQLAKTEAALKKNGFAVERFETGEAAGTRVLAFAAEAATVGFGGSYSVTDLGLPAKIAALGKECLIHGLPEYTPEERLAVMRRQLTCDLFLTGANAVTLDGKIVNIDATGNRVGAMTFGPKKVVILAGVNKLAANVEEGVARVRRWAAPPNAYRLGIKTPCTETGFCADCDSPQRICRVVHVMEKKPRLTDVTVLLVAEVLGL